MPYLSHLLSESQYLLHANLSLSSRHLAASQQRTGNSPKAGRGAKVALARQHAAGGFVFAVCLFGWYLLTAQLLATVDFALTLPVGDLSGMIKGASEKKTVTVEEE